MLPIYVSYFAGGESDAKDNKSIINTVSGGLLIVVGILMATGAFGKFLSLMA